MFGRERPGPRLLDFIADLAFSADGDWVCRTTSLRVAVAHVRSIGISCASLVLGVVVMGRIGRLERGVVHSSLVTPSRLLLG